MKDFSNACLSTVAFFTVLLFFGGALMLAACFAWAPIYFGAVERPIVSNECSIASSLIEASNGYFRLQFRVRYMNLTNIGCLARLHPWTPSRQSEEALEAYVQSLNASSRLCSLVSPSADTPLFPLSERAHPSSCFIGDSGLASGVRSNRKAFLAMLVISIVFLAVSIGSFVFLSAQLRNKYKYKHGVMRRRIYGMTD